MEFATSFGMILKLCTLDSREQVMKFDCAAFSCFPGERESLFFGGKTVLKIEGIMQYAEGQWQYYDKYMEPINAFNHMIHGLSLKGQAILSLRTQRKIFLRLIQDRLQAKLSEFKKGTIVDFSAMSETIQMSETLLKDGLKEYQLDGDRLIGDLIDVVYDEDDEKMPIWSKLNLEDERKREVFRDLLHQHFECEELNPENFIKICYKIVRRLILRVNIPRLDAILMKTQYDSFKNMKKILKDRNAFFLLLLYSHFLILETGDFLLNTYLGFSSLFKTGNATQSCWFYWHSEIK